MRWLLSFVFLLSMVGAPPATAGSSGPDDPAAPSYVAADDSAPTAPHPFPAEESPGPEDNVAPAAGFLLGTGDREPARRPGDPLIPAGTDRSPPRPPPAR